MYVISSHTNPLKSMFAKTINPTMIIICIAFSVVRGTNKLLKENSCSSGSLWDMSQYYNSLMIYSIRKEKQNYLFFKSNNTYSGVAMTILYSFERPKSCSVGFTNT